MTRAHEDFDLVLARRRVHRLRSTIREHAKIPESHGTARHLMLWRELDHLRSDIDEVVPPHEPPDAAILTMTLAELVEEAKRLEQGILTHFKTHHHEDADHILHALVPDEKRAAA